MTASKEERFSALLDGEVSDFEKRRLVDELLKDEDAQGQWMRSHLIGDAMRGELPETISMDFAAAIRDKIELEEEIKLAKNELQQVIEELETYFKDQYENYGAQGYTIACEAAVELDENTKTDAVAIDIRFKDENSIPMFYIPYTMNWETRQATFGKMFAVKRDV